MNIGKTFYTADRAEWRAWLKRYHRSAKEIWLIYYKNGSGTPRIPYNDAVDEALCYGWIDSLLKPIDGKCYAQRFSPRKPGSTLSAMNKERVRKLIRQKKMTAAGLAAIKHTFTKNAGPERGSIAPDILRALKKNPAVWTNFQKFPLSYRRIRIGWIEASRHRPEYFRSRLHYFLAMTGKNKKYGMVQ
jgi:uncharacterized protein YdeI (YjbR/CyaY-like superfamily)